uniref:Uncharacterized protein n=1 Tax=Anguilla anguilla TaxID=7936 RepID=A0A0E9RCU5_ANGAN
MLSGAIKYLLADIHPGARDGGSKGYCFHFKKVHIYF